MHRHVNAVPMDTKRMFGQFAKRESRLRFPFVSFIPCSLLTAMIVYLLLTDNCTPKTDSSGAVHNMWPASRITAQMRVLQHGE